MCIYVYVLYIYVKIKYVMDVYNLVDNISKKYYICISVFPRGVDFGGNDHPVLFLDPPWNSLRNASITSITYGMSTQFLKNFHPVFNPTGNPAVYASLYTRTYTAARLT